MIIIIIIIIHRLPDSELEIQYWRSGTGDSIPEIQVWRSVQEILCYSVG